MNNTAALETASWARRILALVVDWFACTFVVIAVIGLDRFSTDRFASFYTMGAFVLESSILTALAGGSFGKLATRLRVVRIDGGPVDLVRSLLRAMMICLVIPPLVFRPDGRGLHDLATRSMCVPLALLGRSG